MEFWCFGSTFYTHGFRKEKRLSSDLKVQSCVEAMEKTFPSKLWAHAAESQQSQNNQDQSQAPQTGPPRKNQNHKRLVDPPAGQNETKLYRGRFRKKRCCPHRLLLCWAFVHPKVKDRNRDRPQMLQPPILTRPSIRREADLCRKEKGCRRWEVYAEGAAASWRGVETMTEWERIRGGGGDRQGC